MRDAKEAQQAVAQALQVLREFYAKAGSLGWWAWAGDGGQGRWCIITVGKRPKVWLGLAGFGGLLWKYEKNQRRMIGYCWFRSSNNSINGETHTI